MPLAVTFGRECYDASAEFDLFGKISCRTISHIYLNKKPNEPIDPLRREFIEYIFSKDGQAQTEKSGFYPITNEVREKELKKLGLSNLAN